MSTPQNIQNSILKAIDTIAQRRVDQLKLDKTIVGIIKAPIGVSDGKKLYKVGYEGGFFTAIAQNENDAYLPQMSVYVQIPEGDFSNEKFILGRASNIATSSQISAVAAATNSYGIIGKNIFEPNSEFYGVRSYHSLEEESIQENGTIKNVEHRCNFLYNNEDYENNKLIVNKEDLKLYQKDATAVMFRADFMNKLTSDQRLNAKGEFGLIFNLVFKNLAASLGKTQGNFFDYYAKDIKIYIEDEEISLFKIDKSLENILENEEDWDIIQQTDGLLDEKINQIQELERVFKNNNPDKYNDDVQEIFRGYLVLLKDLKQIQNRNARQEWRNVEISQPAEKTLSYYLSSNDMIGNPFYFTSWISQYAVFEIDLNNFLRIDSVLLYKEGFIENSTIEKTWPITLDEQGKTISGGPDIFTKNIQMYMMKPLSEENGIYQLKVEALETGTIFNEETDKPIVVEASLYRQYIENLTGNQDTTFYWFKQDSSVISPTQTEYSTYGGIGWSLIFKENENSVIPKINHSPSLKIYFNDCKAYENYYKCVAVYTGEETPIILKYDFIIYNNQGQKFIIQSDMGNLFNFDAGTPTLTVYKEEKENNELIEIDSDGDYLFYWAIVDGNGQKVFLNQKTESSEISSTVNFLDYSNQNKNTSKILSNIEYYNHEKKLLGDRVKYATRIKYPMSNIALDSKVTFEVYVNFRRNINEDFFSLGKALFEISNVSETAANDYRIYIENGNQVFQYDEYGLSPTSGKRKDPQEILPLKAKLFTPNNLEVQSTNFRIKWYFPINNSLIEWDEEKENSAEIDPVTSLKNVIKGQEISFNIKSLYDYNSTNNQISCQIDFNNKTLYAETNFLFTKIGNNGTNGTDITAKLIPRKWDSILLEQPLTLIVDTTNDEMKTMLNTGARVSRNEIYKKEILIGEAKGILNQETDINSLSEYSILLPTLYQKNQELEPDLVRWNIAGNTSTASVLKGKDYFLTDNSLIWEWNKNNNNPYRQYIPKAELKYQGKTYYAFYSMPIIVYNQTPSVFASNRIGILNRSYLKEVVYNADGRNPLYDHNQGLELINLPENCSVNWYAKGGYVEEEDKPNFSLLLEKDNDKEKVTKIKAIKITEAEDDVIETEVNNITRVYVLPDDSFSGEVTNNYIKAVIIDNETKKIIATVYAPIYMSLNTFGLASLNAWDGNSITIDEQDGYIMAPQIGAGYKDDETNLFTGVVMGRADDYSSGEEHLYTGLLGYKDGMRSFFLDAENGNAIFGYPTTDSSTNKIKKYENGEWKEIDNYNEGLIELRPGEESKIGGWRFGRRSLYYVSDNGEIGDKYKKDYVPNAGGTITSGTRYNAHHERDIPEDKAGILLHSGEQPYISIKGKQLNIEEDGLSQSAESYLLDGDSLEVQIDPQTPTLFTIFRHNGQTRYKNASKEEVLYPEGSRTYLAGINSRGQLVANGLQTVTKPTSASEDAVTTFGIDTIPAFGETIDNASYIGFKLEANDNMISKIFVKNNNKKDSTLYMSGAGDATNEYVRPISFHGKDISLYASSKESKLPTTTHYFKLSNSSGASGAGDYAEIKVGENTYLQLKENNDAKNYLVTHGSMEFWIGYTGNNNVWKNFNIYSGDLNIDTHSKLIKINSGQYNLTSSGAITIKSIGDNNITIKRQTNVEEGNDSQVDIYYHEIWNWINGSNYIKITDNIQDTSNFYSNAPIDIKSERSISLKSKTTNTSVGNINTASGMYFETTNNDDKNKTTLRLTPHSTLTSPNSAARICYPFYLEFIRQKASVGRIDFACESKNNTWTNYLEVYANQIISNGGLLIEGTYQNDGVHGLKVDKGITANSFVSYYNSPSDPSAYAAKGFSFGEDATFIKDGTKVSGSNMYDIIMDLLNQINNARTSAKSYADTQDSNILQKAYNYTIDQINTLKKELNVDIRDINNNSSNFANAISEVALATGKWSAYSVGYTTLGEWSWD